MLPTRRQLLGGTAGALLASLAGPALYGAETPGFDDSVSVGQHASHLKRRRRCRRQGQLLPQSGQVLPPYTVPTELAGKRLYLQFAADAALVAGGEYVIAARVSTRPTPVSRR
ncbi:hypothetical protein ACF090_11095 [Streptomyces sp. NPDC014892]|uniref:hypothetical protein n=1 Tax=Streptomyces sp. NPDC014892 TaxID=3364930 RepID=UPI0036F80FAE